MDYLYINTHSCAPFPIFMPALQPLLKEHWNCSRHKQKKHTCKTHVVHLESLSISVYLIARSTMLQYLLLHAYGTFQKQEKVTDEFHVSSSKGHTLHRTKATAQAECIFRNTFSFCLLSCKNKRITLHTYTKKSYSIIRRNITEHMNLYARRKYQKEFNLYKKLLHVKDANITITILNQLKVSKNITYTENTCSIPGILDSWEASKTSRRQEDQSKQKKENLKKENHFEM